MVRALLFDLDRTLVDLQSFTDYGAARREAEALIEGYDGIVLPPTDWSADTVAAMGLLVACSADPRWHDVSAAIERYETAAVPASTAMPRVHEAWELTAAVPHAVVTLLPEGAARQALHQHGLDHPGLVIVGRRADQRPKPAPDGVVAACSELGVEPAEAVMIGDSTWDLEAAEAAGCRFIGVPTDPGNLPSGTLTAPDIEAAVRLALG